MLGASTTKLAVALALAREVSRGRRSLDEVVATFPAVDEETGEVAEQPYTLRDMASDALVHSDNDATVMLIDELGEATIRTTMSRAGGLTVPWIRGENLTSTDDLAAYMGAMLARARPGSAAEMFLSDLEHTDFDEWIPLGLPEGVRVAHKVGQYDDASGDVGVFWVGSRPVIVAVLCRGLYEDGSLSLIPGVVWDVYQAELASDPSAPRPEAMVPLGEVRGDVGLTSHPEPPPVPEPPPDAEALPDADAMPDPGDDIAPTEPAPGGPDVEAASRHDERGATFTLDDDLA